MREMSSEDEVEFAKVDVFICTDCVRDLVRCDRVAIEFTDCAGHAICESQCFAPYDSGQNCFVLSAKIERETLIR
jgi:hypothetical protein